MIPKTKHMASNMFDFPDPLSPVIALKCGSNLLGSNSNNDDEKMSGKVWTFKASREQEYMNDDACISISNTSTVVP